MKKDELKIGVELGVEVIYETNLTFEELVEKNRLLDEQDRIARENANNG